MPLPARIAKSMPPRVPRVRSGDSKAHLKFIRSLPCCVCGVAGTDPHHLMRGVDGVKGIGRKHEDRWCISACRSHHNAMHAAGDDEVWLIGHGIDGRALAAALWRVSGDHEAGLRIVERARR